MTPDIVQSGRYAVIAHLSYAVATMLVYALVRPPWPARLEGRRGPIAVLGAWAYWVTRPILRGAAALGITADLLTGAGLLLNVGAGLLAALGAWGWAFVLLLWGSTADLLDGELARSTGTSSPAGAFLDSNLDRISELAFLAGLGLALPGRVGALSATAALAASFMVSYARARGEGLGVSCPTFGLERPHRLVVFIFTLLPASFLAPEDAAALLTCACALVAVGAGMTALGRMVVIHQLLRRPEPSREWDGTPPAGLP
jgi:CDP-diacylglycerol---glycerol-3-phosphate 3-phosphatidyltransferase